MIKKIRSSEKKADIIIPRINQIVQELNEHTERWEFLKKLLPEIMEKAGYLDDLGLRLTKKKKI